jgi:hypothetical protein
VPLLLVRGSAQRIEAPVRRGSTGALVAPSSATVTITRPDGTAIVSGASCTISSSVAGYTLTPGASETLGAGWTVSWALAMTDGDMIPWREEAYLCEYVPPCSVSATDLYTVSPELRYRVPEAQGSGGTDEGWQPQIDAAYEDLLRQLMDDGHRPWQIRTVAGYHPWLLARSVQRCLEAIPSAPGDTWETERRSAHFRMVSAAAGLRIQYVEDAATTHRGAGPVIRLCPPERAQW